MKNLTSTFEVQTFIRLTKCECGGHLSEEVYGTLLTSNPPQKTFRCDECGIERTLTEYYWPLLSYKRVKVNG